MAIQRIEIDKDKVLLPGDRIELHFKTTSMLWVTAAQIALIEWRIGKRDDWEILSNSLPANNRVIFTILVKDSAKTSPVLQTAGIGVTAAVIAAAIVAVGVISWLTLDKVLQIMETPEGKIAVAGTGVGIAAAGIGLLLLLLLPKK